ncbi:MAG: CPBP family intramembrane metalloprotease [Calditrichaeota bacterium]|nr:MAG: CPBP family intramembrane metalloprotease [Calditrichota bacterium]MBL1205150.1 CPBP family intramembrane metalloprotease [Calditrichota bacterium]NOG44980.1 CPBP family intramembrane metalloprotease [Calditrichota bacterium]
MKYPSFKTAFWLIFILIISMQIIQVIYSLQVYGWNVDSYPPKYYLHLDLFSIGWYIASVILVGFSFSLQNLSAHIFYNFNFDFLRKYFIQTIKYFGGAALAVLTLSFIFPEPEFYIDENSVIMNVLAVFVTVIMAPVCEELVFRGYLYSAMIPVFKRKKERLVVNAMLFASAHVFFVSFVFGEPVPFYIFILGYLIAKLYEESRSVLPGILLHLLNNGLVVIIDFIKTDLN